ncbi:unnamed protein product [Oncorhynchus mykiss]|uniref:Uncharacterized protein n=1 Tax=Oncorhynchus mykiss TaxID=8022 RepID=A0A060Z9Y6_ONCMY|nr:unnamed protein product [Oncorhynchus mykiss]
MLSLPLSNNVSIKKVNSSTIEWSYPVSWNRPISYFPLSFQVKEIEGRKCKNGCTCDSPYTEVHTTESSQWSVKAKVTVCVRAQDALCDSPWSDWTEYRLNNKGNKRGRREKQKKKKNVSQ